MADASQVAWNRKTHGFHGGLTLPHHKERILRQPIRLATLPKHLMIPLWSYGDPPQQRHDALIVQPDQWLTAGEPLLCQATHRVNRHVPVSGTVGDIVTFPLPGHSGQELQCLTLRVDSNQTPQGLPSDASCGEVQAIPPIEDLLHQFHQMGVVGLGGAQFPTHLKARQASGHVDTLILNGVECEPYIACDEALMRLRPGAIYWGGQLLAHAIGARRVIIALESSDHGIEPSLDAIWSQTLGDWSGLGGVACAIHTLPSRYPQGAERTLIKAVLGQEVPAGALPSDIGVMVNNVATAAACFDAVVRQQPLTHRLVTVAGSGIQTPCNVYAPIGLPLHDLVAEADGYRAEATKRILGGPISGVTLQDDRLPVDKGTHGLIGLSAKDTHSSPPTMPCINCGECVTLCPAQLLPQTLYKLVQSGQYAKAEHTGLGACIECGVCAEVCPSHLPLVEWYRHGKAVLHANHQDQTRARWAEQRYEAREARLADARAEKERKRQARASRLKAPASAQSEIEASIARARAKRGQTQ